MDELTRGELRTIHEKLEEVNVELARHTQKEEDFQARVTNSFEKMDRLQEDFNNLQSRYEVLLNKVDQHLHQSEELSRSFKKSLWGAVTLTLGAIVGLAWEWLKTHIMLTGKPHP